MEFESDVIVGEEFEVGVGLGKMERALKKAFRVKIVMWVSKGLSHLELVFMVKISKKHCHSKNLYQIVIKKASRCIKLQPLLGLGRVRCIVVLLPLLRDGFYVSNL